MEQVLRCCGWSDEVRQALCDFIAANGTDAPDYDPNVYTVFDFDNTTAIFDSADQLMIYQLERMAFPLSPDALMKALFGSLDLAGEITLPGGRKCRYDDWYADLSAAYRRLYQTYGPFPACGLSEEAAKTVQKDPFWQEFATKMRLLYDLICENEGEELAYGWITFWFAGMTEQQVYDLALASHRYYGRKKTSRELWRSPADLPSRLGAVRCSWLSGFGVTEEVRELMLALRAHGIAVWICSASFSDIIRAAVDAFGLHEAVSGVLSMACRTENGIYLPETDRERDFAWICLPGGAWVRDTVPQCAATQGMGKVTAIQNVLCKKYGHGPAAGFMDSTGDFLFCTAFRTMQLALCFNRADRRLTDGGALIAALAVYQRDTLGYDLRKAQEAGDILYLLQGRDENGLRALLPGRSSLLLDESEPKLFRGAENDLLLNELLRRSMTTAQAILSFAPATPAEDRRNLLGFRYGFLTETPRYRSLP